MSLNFSKPPPQKKKIGGKSGSTRLIYRHPELCRRSIQAISLFHTIDCKRAVKKYTLELLTYLIGKCSFTPGNMHNGTESGIATTLNMPINVLGFRGKSQVEVFTWVERGTLVNSYLHERLRKFHAKDVSISSCEKSLAFTATAVRKSDFKT